MSRFLEISTKSLVNVDQISWVASSEDGMSSIVYVGGKEYPSNIPYSTLIGMVKNASGASTEKKLDNYLSVAPVTVL